MRYIVKPLEIVQVELTGQTWWSAALPVLAIVISLASLAITLWLKFRDDARLELSATRGYVLGIGDAETLYLHLEATNVGRSGSTVVQSLGLRLSDGQGLVSISQTAMDSNFPETLGPGETAHRYLNFNSVATKVTATGLHRKRIRIEAISGHGRVRANVPKSLMQCFDVSDAQIPASVPG